jgi:signal transduction histidine kinase/DNA-binding response OmpR family regulator/HAMP domain-containing protein
MRRLSIARLLLLSLVGLTLTLAALAALTVGALLDARQDYEDGLASGYAGEVAAANVLATSVVEERVVGDRRSSRAERAEAARAFAHAVAEARAAADGDGRSLELVAAAEASQRRLRATRRPPVAGREAMATYARRQVDRRAAAREEASDRTRRGVISAAIAGLLALVAVLALVARLLAGMRRPLTSLIAATRQLAAGELDTRVEPEGPAELRELASAFNAMAADLGAAQARIEAGRRRLAAVIESLGDALIICDGYGRVVQVNPRAEVLVPTVTVGSNVAKEAGPLPPLDSALGREVDVDHDGRTLTVTAARMGERLEDGVVFTVRDTTERARLERAKTEFVATASHELRSPLTSIKGFVELLAQTELNARQREFVDVVLLSTNRLADLVNDLLDVARVEAGQLEIQRRPISVAEAVREVAALMAPQFADRDQELVVDIAPALPVALADPARVRQIVTNLLTNAHLYTGEGGRVTVSVGASGDSVLLAVSDQGRGMSEEQVDKAFQRFFRADGSRGTGTGLGLSIVQSLVELHEGSVDISSSVGRGTTVTVRLPRARVATDLAEPRDALQGRRVLVIEDDPETAQLIVAQLGALEVEAHTTADGTEALALLRRERFDAVTLDILLGNGSVDGFAVLSEIRSDPELGRLPIIVVSALAGQETLAAEWSVSKPIDADELTDAIGSAILAGRARVLVVGRAAMRDVVGPLLDRRGIDYAWATSGAEANRMCEETHFEVALVDAGMRSPQAALAQLNLRGRRLRRSVVVFSAEGDASGMARMDPLPMPVEDATRAVVEALRDSASIQVGR